MNRKICFLIGGVFLSFAVGYGLVYAYAIPGWDRPYDPPNYYDPISISWADTNTPTFFYRDIGWQGGTVYDYTRHFKSIAFVGQFGSWLTTVLDKLNLTIANMTPLDTTARQQTQTEVIHIQEDSIRSNKSQTALDILHSNLFRDSNRYDDDSNSYTPRQQMEMLQQVYSGFAQSAQDAVSQREPDQAVMEDILQHANTATGALQVDQANAQMEALKQAEHGRRNALLANIAACDAITHKAEMDANLAGERQAAAAKLYVVDPYNETDREQQTYSRPEPRGFVEFK